MSKKSKTAFTLIEVIISVLIITLVIGALLQMSGNTTHLFSKFTKEAKFNQYITLILSNENYGFKNDSIDLNKLVDEFDIESKLKRELKSAKIKLVYQELEKIDISESDDENASSTASFEIGRTTIKTQESSVSALRLNLR